MKNLTKNMSLLDLEKKFEEEITSEDIRIIGDLNIAYEDYITIREKINKLMDYKDNITVWNQYRLCTLVSWVFSLIYEDTEYNATNFMESFDGFHQYTVRYLLDIYNETFEEFGLEIPGLVINSEESLQEAIILQAGVPDEYHKVLFDTLNSTVDETTVNIEKDVMMDFSPKIKTMFKCLNRDRQKKLVNLYRKAFIEIKVKGMSRDEVLRRNPITSRRVISSFDKMNKKSIKEEMLNKEMLAM